MAENLYPTILLFSFADIHLVFRTKRMFLFGDIFERYLVIESEMADRHLTEFQFCLRVSDE